MKKKEISIIVPVYNSSKYLDECIKSILNQSFKNFELILINDGSTDDSLDICDNYKKIDDRIIVLNKENSGVASARNIGLKSLNGSYISFVDSDDTLPCNALEILYEKIKNNKYDIVIGNYLKIDEYNNMLGKQSINNNLIDFKEFIVKNRLWAPWGKLVKRECINAYFDKDIHILEDCLFWLSNTKINSFYFIDEVVYYYRINNNSLMNIKILDYRQISEFNALNKIFDLQLNDYLKELFSFFYINRLFYIKRNYEDRTCWFKTNKKKINSIVVKNLKSILFSKHFKFSEKIIIILKSILIVI